MAQIYPSDIPYDFQKDPKRLAERLLFNLFRDELVIYLSLFTSVYHLIYHIKFLS